MITLHSGPHSGKVLDDRGKALIKMCLYDPCERIGARVGYAYYEPNSARTEAFWLCNEWEGVLLDQFPEES